MQKYLIWNSTYTLKPININHKIDFEKFVTSWYRQGQICKEIQNNEIDSQKQMKWLDCLHKRLRTNDVHAEDEGSERHQESIKNNWHTAWGWGDEENWSGWLQGSIKDKTRTSWGCGDKENGSGWLQGKIENKSRTSWEWGDKENGSGWLQGRIENKSRTSWGCGDKESWLAWLKGSIENMTYILRTQRQRKLIRSTSGRIESKSRTYWVRGDKKNWLCWLQGRIENESRTGWGYENKGKLGVRKHREQVTYILRMRRQGNMSGWLQVSIENKSRTGWGCRDKENWST